MTARGRTSRLARGTRRDAQPPSGIFTFYAIFLRNGSFNDYACIRIPTTFEHDNDVDAKHQSAQRHHCEFITMGIRLRLLRARMEVATANGARSRCADAPRALSSLRRLPNVFDLLVAIRLVQRIK
ncbi:hypothetical protein EVAR_80890_1 [Eumeta japonica]|uniref:Uncharacterized protein n=1 Tax=Eumeta variegata TaxID=151549 RepID=A0A4C1V209_EUMVA|nr:hypothetical protein EVAR_80890_1 [Eumeta japonica]